MKKESLKLHTYLGYKINVLDPKPDDFNIRDIVHSLCGLPRYCNQIRIPYTVGAHSVYTAMIALKSGESIEVAFACLMHDASEAYLNDIPNPVKIYCRDYLKIEKNFMKKIFKKFSINMKLLKAVDRYDKIAYYSEQRDLTANKYQPLAYDLPVPREQGHELEFMFIDLFTRLKP